MTDDVHDPGSAPPTGVRLEFRTAPGASVAFDGAWWPRTRNSIGELAALIHALDVRRTRVRLLMLNPYGWRDRPRRIDAAGRVVRIEWITMLDRSVVIGATDKDQRIDLRLIVPAGDQRAAPPPQPPTTGGAEAEP
ncbi:MAG TPA: DUF5994 family protein [Dactylosporangium sp.]|jgi:hypothetical protein|nr:DUF5994 family protein [Dactylosporangium sp.]